MLRWFPQASHCTLLIFFVGPWILFLPVGKFLNFLLVPSLARPEKISSFIRYSVISSGSASCYLPLSSVTALLALAGHPQCHKEKKEEKLLRIYRNRLFYYYPNLLIKVIVPARTINTAGDCYCRFREEHMQKNRDDGDGGRRSVYRVRWWLISYFLGQLCKYCKHA